MQKKDYETLVNEYEKLHSNRSDMYLLSHDEDIEKLKASFSSNSFMNAPFEKKIKLVLLWLSSDCRSLMKYYNAFKANDIECLNNVLYETGHYCK